MKAAILAEVQPHIKTLKDARNKLQSSVDAAKVSYFSNLCYIFLFETISIDLQHNHLSNCICRTGGSLGVLAGRCEGGR